MCFGQCAEQMRQILYMSPVNGSTILHPAPPPKKKHRRQSADPLNDPEEHKSINFFIWDELFSVKSVRLY